MHLRNRCVLLFSGLITGLCLSLTIQARLIECESCQNPRYAVSGDRCAECLKVAPASVFDGKTYTDRFNWLAYDMFIRACKREPEKNRVISNHSIVSMLALLAFGSSGHTSQKLAEYLQVEEHHIPALWQWLEKGLIAAKPGLTEKEMGRAEIFTSSNIVLVRGDHGLHPVFKQYMSQHVPAALLAGDIDWQNAAGLVGNVNEAIRQATHDLIPSCLDNESLSQRNPAIALLNAIYLQAPWAKIFTKISGGGAFWLPGMRESLKEVHMMHCQDMETTCYGEHNNWEVVEKTCGFSQHFEMVMMLPPKGTLPTKLALEQFNKMLKKTVDQGRGKSQWQGYMVELTMPAFKVEAEADLQTVLPPFIFSPEACLDSLLKNSGAWVEEMKQQAVVRVDEKGIAAAAVTSTCCADGCSKAPGYVNVTLDRPFLYMIRHIPSKSILFIGQLCDPSKAQL